MAKLCLVASPDENRLACPCTSWLCSCSPPCKAGWELACAKEFWSEAHSCCQTCLPGSTWPHGPSLLFCTGGSHGGFPWLRLTCSSPSCARSSVAFLGRQGRRVGISDFDLYSRCQRTMGLKFRASLATLTGGAFSVRTSNYLRLWKKPDSSFLLESQVKFHQLRHKYLLVSALFSCLPG